ncbi:hypothetical protein [Maribacter antarcticus]|uniref:hypothetical protein n=1 Tax=Maribacter antarcticus TaxID=505250 RepID=UPI000A9EB477|nr:hypothetical protein [Maribacter antarcticus]
MSEIVNPIVLGVLTVTIWLAVSILLNYTRNITNITGNKQITFVGILTIYYEGNTTKI